MKGAIAKELAEAKLQNIPITTTKIIQLYETKNSRHSTMIVGQSGSGKSVTWRTLRNVLTRLKKEIKDGPYQAVKDYPINPKALSLGELYGEFDLATNEWSDGVLSSVMRQTCAGVWVCGVREGCEVCGMREGCEVCGVNLPSVIGSQVCLLSVSLALCTLVHTAPEQWSGCTMGPLYSWHSVVCLVCAQMRSRT